MNSQSQDTLDSLIPPPQVSEPITPPPSYTTLPDGNATSTNKLRADRIGNAEDHMTPPPSTQMSSSQRGKTRTPTPTYSHMSTPPATIEMPSQIQTGRLGGGFAATMTHEQLAAASVEELRTTICELQAAYQEAKMSAAHHRLQHQMLSQESTAAIERMAVEARMAQYENEVIYIAEQAKVAATPVQPSPMQEGMIPVQKDLYQSMCRELQQLTEANGYLENERDEQEKIILGQETEIASLTDKVWMMRERIRENREHLNRFRGSSTSRIEGTPRSLYGAPQRGHISGQQDQAQPFAALLQASEMASQEAVRGGKKGHNRNIHSLSSLPATPNRMYKPPHATMYHTPAGRQPPPKVPSTAPLPRTSAMRTPDVYAQHQLPVPSARQVSGPPSEGTVSASDHAGDDSEAETDIIDPDNEEVSESQASRAASQMLRSSQEQEAKRASFDGSGMLPPRQQAAQGELRQSKLFGAVRKAGVGRDGERPAKKARLGQGVGLGIAGVRH